MGHTKYFMKNWKKLTSDKIVLGTVKGLEIQFKRKLIQKKILVTVLRSEAKYQSLKAEIQTLLKKNAIKQVPVNSIKVFESSFYCPKFRWIFLPNDKLKTIELTHSQLKCKIQRSPELKNVAESR